jgi:DNA-binding NtrC family response regulator
MMTAYHENVSQVVDAIKIGAYDYLEKPFKNEEIVLLLEQIEREMKARMEWQKIKATTEKTGYGGLIGKSPRVLEVYQLIESVSQADCSVLIDGESGTGKELIAEAIHQASPRRDFPIVKMSCAVFPENLIESELFGHEKGAFTDAKTQKIGRFEMANKGTIFLDDIDDMSAQTQVKLLRVLQEREFERIGGTTTIKIDIRILVATKSDLLTRVKNGSFREDLYYRLNVVTIRVPPLRERTGDIRLLLNHFITKYGKGRDYQVEAETLLEMENYNWPGNVRELENAVERAIALAGDNPILKKEYLIKPPAPAQDTTTSSATTLLGLTEYLNQMESDYLTKLLKLTKGNKGEMAQILQISRKSLWEKLKKYGLG